jgi:transcriptional antiterminator RfaH
LHAPIARAEFKQGEHVMIRAGELCDIEAIFLTTDGAERAVILLNLLQREQKVVLPMSSLLRMEARV